jgi:hypothetical protein
VQVHEVEKPRPCVSALKPASAYRKSEGGHYAFSANPSPANFGIKAVAQVAPLGTGLSLSAKRCLTPHSSRAPTAKHHGRATVHVCFYCSAALALCRWCRLSSNVRPHQMPVTPAAVRASGRLRVVSVLAVAVASNTPAEIAAGTRIKNVVRSGYKGAAGGGNASPGAVFLASEPRSGCAACRTSGGEATRWSVPWHKPALARVLGSVQVLCAAAPPPSTLRLSLRRSELALPSHLVVAEPPAASRRGQPGGSHQVRPNPSLKPSPNSKTPGPRYSAVHHLQRGPGVFLSVPA